MIVIRLNQCSGVTCSPPKVGGEQVTALHRKRAGKLSYLIFIVTTFVIAFVIAHFLISVWPWVLKR